MESGVYNITRSHHDIRTRDKASQSLLYNSFVAPMPYVGSTISPIDSLPLAADNVSSLDTPYPRFYTSWNVQSHSVITSFSSTTHTSAQSTPRARPPRTETSILQDGALQQILDLTTYFTPKQVLMLSSNRMWLSKRGEILLRLPRGVSYRSAPLSSAEATSIAERLGAAASSSSDEFEESMSSLSMEIIDAARETDPISGPSSEVRSDTPVEPACRSKISVIPCVAVKSLRTSFQAGSPTTPPKSKVCIALEAHMADTKAATQPLVNSARSPLARDTAATQMLLSFMSVSNASHIDTVPILRGMLYIYGQPDNVFNIDKIPNHFVRGEDLTNTPTRGSHIHARAENRDVVRIMCCTLSAFASHMKGQDTGMAQEWPVALMDDAWTAVPITSDMISQSWVREYTLTFLSSEIWAGRLSRRSRHVHLGNAGARENTAYTTIPKAHNVYIPGPTSLVLVMVDENVNTTNPTVPIITNDGLRIYRGSQYLRDGDTINAHIVDATEIYYGLPTTLEQSAIQMSHALEWMERNLCVDMAFQLAFSLAAEISACCPESPYLEVSPDGAHRYENPLNGAWTFGVKHLSTDNPRHTTADISGGPLDNRVERYTSCVHAYNFAAVSPLQQYPASMVEITNEAVVENNIVVGYRSHWTRPQPKTVVPQYQAHISHSAYRVLAALGMIEKNDYSFSIASPQGLQSMITLQSAVLTLSYCVYATKNDISRHIWSGLGMQQGAVARGSASRKVSEVTAGHVIYLNAHQLLSRSHRTGQTINADLQAYYAASADTETWAASVCIPYFAVLQWASKFNINMFLAVDAEYGPVSATHQTMHIELCATNRGALPWYASSGCTAASTPRVVLCRDRLGPIFLPLSVDQWEVLSVGRSGHLVGESLVSNVLAPSLAYHMRDTRNEDKALVINQKMMSKAVAQRAWSVDPAMYPDPPNFAFLTKQVAGESEKGPGESDQPGTVTHEQTGPSHASPIQPPLIPVEAKVDITATPLTSDPAPASPGTGPSDAH